MKPTMYRYNPRLLFMREQTPSAACNPETAPMQQVRTDPASRTKWPIQYPTVTALLRAAMSGRVVVCMLKRPTWKCLVPWSAAPTDQLVFLNFIWWPFPLVWRTCLLLCRTCCPRNHGMAKQAGNQNSCSSSAKWSGRTLNVMAFVAMHAQNSAANPQATSKEHRLHQIHSDTISVGWARDESPDSSQNIKLHWICWEALWGCGQDKSFTTNPQVTSDAEKLHWISSNVIAHSTGNKLDCKTSSHMKVARLKATEEADILQCMFSELLSTMWYVPSRYACKNPEVWDSPWVCIWFDECVP